MESSWKVQNISLALADLPTRVRSDRSWIGCRKSKKCLATMVFTLDLISKRASFPVSSIASFLVLKCPVLLC